MFGYEYLYNVHFTQVEVLLHKLLENSKPIIYITLGFLAKVVDKGHTDFFHYYGTIPLSIQYESDFDKFDTVGTATCEFLHAAQSSTLDTAQHRQILCRRYLSIA